MRYFFLISFLLTGSFAVAQFPGGGGGGFNPASVGQNRGGAPASDKPPARDTSEVIYFYLDNPGQDYVLQDTVLEPYFLQYDLIRRPALQYGHLGIPGTAAFPLTSRIEYRRGFDVGLHQYDLYRITPEKIRYYKVEQAYTRAAFSQGFTQQETTFGAEFAREFAGNFTLSFDYRRTANTGFYENQFAQNSALAVNGWVHSDSDRYRAFFNFTLNTNDHLENGGLSSVPQNAAGNRDTIDNPVLAQIFLSAAANAQNRYAERGLFFKHFYKLNRSKTDSLLSASRAFTLIHEASYARNTYKYTDAVPVNETDFYGAFVTDTRGLRHYIKHQKIENTVALSTFKTQPGAEKNTTIQKDLLELGLMHRYNFVEQEPEEITLHEVFATVRWQIAPGDRLRLDTYAHLGLLGSPGDYRAAGNLSFNLGKLGLLTATATQQLTRPTLVQNRFFTTQREIYSNDFRKSLSTEIGGSYALPRWQFKGEVSYQLLNNYIFFDTLGMPQQADAAISVGRLTIEQNFKLGSLRSENRVTLQRASTGAIRIPPVYGVHSLYVAGNVFKGAMYAKLGFDLRLNAPYQPYAYQPLNGQFILQNRQTVAWQPITDVFLALKVKKFRFLARYDNFIPELNRRDYFYQAADYSVPYGYFRFAIAWQFVD